GSRATLPRGVISTPSWSSNPSRSGPTDRKSTRLNSSHRCISYAVFCLNKKRPGAAWRHPMLNIRTDLLRTLVAVTEMRSFTKAAQSLGVTHFFFNDRATPEIYPFAHQDLFPS